MDLNIRMSNLFKGGRIHLKEVKSNEKEVKSNAKEVESNAQEVESNAKEVESNAKEVEFKTIHLYSKCMIPKCCSLTTWISRL